MLAVNVLCSRRGKCIALFAVCFTRLKPLVSSLGSPPYGICGRGCRGTVPGHMKQAGRGMTSTCETRRIRKPAGMVAEAGVGIWKE